MTGYTVHTGATEKFVAGWDEIFKKLGKAKGPPASKKKQAAKKVKAAAKTKAPAKMAKSKGRKSAKRKK